MILSGWRLEQSIGSYRHFGLLKTLIYLSFFFLHPDGECLDVFSYLFLKIYLSHMFSKALAYRFSMIMYSFDIVLCSHCTKWVSSQKCIRSMMFLVCMLSLCKFIRIQYKSTEAIWFLFFCWRFLLHKLGLTFWVYAAGTVCCHWVFALCFSYVEEITFSLTDAATPGCTGFSR